MESVLWPFLAFLNITRIFRFWDIAILELSENNQILELRENNRVMVVLTKLDFWPFGLENGLEGQF